MIKPQTRIALLVLLSTIALATYSFVRSSAQPNSASTGDTNATLFLDENPTAQTIEKDLQLLAELKGEKSLLAGSRQWVSVTLKNTSRNRIHRVVKPQHGSEIANREPYIYWTATLDSGDGVPKEYMDKVNMGYCGTCLASASNWSKDGLELKPGESLEIPIPQQLDFQKPGRIRLQAHYEYQTKVKVREHQFKAEDLKFFEGLPSFRLTSNAVEFEVVRPLEVRVKVKQNLKVKEKTKLSDLFEITLFNATSNAIECHSPTLHAEARLNIQISGEFGGWSPRLDEQKSTYGIKRELAPNQSLPLLGENEFANGLDGSWEYPVEGVVKVRASYMPTTWKSGPIIYSDWVEIRAQK